MEKYIWKKTNYKLIKASWGIGILLEAGYQIVPAITEPNQYIKITDQIYFLQSLILSYPESETMDIEEINCFCHGLKLASKYISSSINIPENSFLIIAINWIQFSLCNVQNEGFTALAIQWASEMFHFPMPTIDAYFDSLKGYNGMYVFDFRSV